MLRLYMFDAIGDCSFENHIEYSHEDFKISPGGLMSLRTLLQKVFQKF